METVTDRYDQLASLLQYPRKGYHDRVESCRRECASTMPEARTAFDTFAEAIQGLAPEDVEELFTRTFDLNPVCSPEVGWHLFGENYSRGEFLVRMRQALRRHGLSESTELPDHLSYVLPVLGRLEPSEAGPFAERYVLPALDKMLAGLAGKDNPYEKLIETIRGLVAAQVPPPQLPTATEVNHE